MQANTATDIIHSYFIWLIKSRLYSPAECFQERPRGANLLRADQGFVAAVVREEKLILHYFVEQEGAEAPALSVARCISVMGPCLAK